MVGTTLSYFVIVVSVADRVAFPFLGRVVVGFALGRIVPSGGGNITETLSLLTLT